MSAYSQSSAGVVNVSGTFSSDVNVTNFPTSYTLVPSGTMDVNSTNGALEATQLLGLPKASTLSKCFRFTVTGSQSTQISFLPVPRTQLVAAISSSKVFTMSGDPNQPVYYAFSTGSTGESISSVDDFSTKQCDVIFASERRDFQIPIGTSSLIVSASVAGSVSLSVTS